MRRVLVTGATCYVGRALLGRLLEMGLDVHVVARPHSDLARMDGLAPTIHRHDGSLGGLTDIAVAAQADVAFHFAGLYRRSHVASDMEALLESNVAFGTRLLEALAAAGTRRLVNVGSYHQFMDGGGYRPFNLYAATKEAFEAILAYYVDAGRLDAATLVLFDTYGEDDWRPKLMAALRRAVVTDGEVPLPAGDLPLDMVHVDDVSRAFLRAAELLETDAGAVRGDRFAVTSGAPGSIEGLVAAFERVSGRPLHRRWGAYPMPEREVTALWRGPALPGWNAQVGLDEGIRRFLEAG